MKNIALTAMVVASLMVGAQAFAFVPYVNGHRTIATPNHVVIGGETFEVKADPQTVEDLQNKVTWIEAQIYDLELAKAALKASECK